MRILRYSGFAGAVWDVWEIRDGILHLVLARPRGGPIHTTVPVCSSKNPVEGAFVISRKTEGWQLAPAVYVGGYALRASVHPDVEAEFFMLSDAAAEAEDFLEALD